MAPTTSTSRKSTKSSTASSKKKGSNLRSSATNASSSQGATATGRLPTLPLELQQLLLSTFQSAFPDLLNPNTTRERLLPTLQRVKHHLYHRDFTAAFGQPDHLEAYAARWSASRALAYLSIFATLLPLLPPPRKPPSPPSAPVAPTSSQPITALCFGGGAGAELVALAGLHHLSPATPITLAVHTVDIASWSAPLAALHARITSPPARRPSAAPLAPAASLALTPHTLDVLAPASRDALGPLVAAADLLTLMFTLNELYAASVARTQALLLELTRWTAARPGVLLCVVDSPGSYSEVALGGAGAADKTRRYPMQWLLDHALLTTAREGEGGAREGAGPWEKVVGEESRWFRLPEGLDYPIELENMRFQMHVYRRV